MGRETSQKRRRMQDKTGQRPAVAKAFPVTRRVLWPPWHDGPGPRTARRLCLRRCLLRATQNHAAENSRGTTQTRGLILFFSFKLPIPCAPEVHPGARAPRMADMFGVVPGYTNRSLNGCFHAVSMSRDRPSVFYLKTKWQGNAKISNLTRVAVSK